MSTRGVPAAPRQTFRSYAASGFGDEVRRWEAYNAQATGSCATDDPATQLGDALRTLLGRS